MFINSHIISSYINISSNIDLSMIHSISYTDPGKPSGPDFTLIIYNALNLCLYITLYYKFPWNINACIYEFNMTPGTKWASRKYLLNTIAHLQSDQEALDILLIYQKMNKWINMWVSEHLLKMFVTGTMLDACQRKHSWWFCEVIIIICNLQMRFMQVKKAYVLWYNSWQIKL